MTRESRTAVLTGGCQCGAVRYALYKWPVGINVCHCRMCQKAVGGPFAALAPVRREDFAWTRGTPGNFVSSTVAARQFCADCGTPLTFYYANGERISVTIGSLDQADQVPAIRQFGMESRIAWLDLVVGLPASTTEEDMTAARKARIVDFQHPDHDTPPDWAPPAGPSGG
ncbi:MAG: GFA family protein [Kiloniellaceae bacterium]